MANIFSYMDYLGGYYVKVLDKIKSKFNKKLEKKNQNFTKIMTVC
jgi:hypothetical protein